MPPNRPKPTLTLKVPVAMSMTERTMMMMKLNKLKYQYSFCPALPSKIAYFFRTSRYQFMCFLLFVLPLMIVPDVRQVVAAA